LAKAHAWLILAVLCVPLVLAASSTINAGDAVTGHTTFVFKLQVQRRNSGNGLPTDFAVVAGYFEHRGGMAAAQRECVTWFNGYNLDQRPVGDHFGWGSRNAYPSDEDEPYAPGAPAGSGDRARQDHDFDRDVDTCVPRVIEDRDPELGLFAVVVESGDCDPRHGRDFKFRAHLDFVDPNDIYHEVQEYSYVCPNGGRDNLVPNPVAPLVPQRVADAVKDLFPTDAFDDGGDCTGATPFYTTWDPQNGEFDHPEKLVGCNARIQAMFLEYLWISPIHAPVWDPTIQRHYTFAIQFDTCDGNQCTDGSPSFDDTSRSKVVHRSPPSGPGSEEIMRGNSYDFDPDSETFGKHRTNCRHVDVRWQRITDRPRAHQQDCYPEDHRTARIDLYVFDHDPTRGLWAANANGFTGLNAYTGPGTPTGPDWAWA
jgi:hypothetical protein